MSIPATDTPKHSLNVSREIQAPLDRVFEAWTVESDVRQWSCPAGATITDVRMDCTPGGQYRIVMEGSEGQVYTAFGEYLEVVSPRRLAYTWDWEESEHAMGATLVEVDFLETVPGRTRVTITQSRFPTAEAADGHEGGWGSCLDKLEGMFPAS